MKLTRQMFSDGIENTEEIKIKDLKEFCDLEGLEIAISPGRGIARILNDIASALEVQGVTETASSGESDQHAVVEQSNPIPKPEPPKSRANGETIRLANDGNDYGSNLINRMKHH